MDVPVFPVVILSLRAKDLVFALGVAVISPSQQGKGKYKRETRSEQTVALLASAPLTLRAIGVLSNRV